MTSQAGYHGGGSQLNPNQCFVKNKTAGEKGSRLRALFEILSSFRGLLHFLFAMAFTLTHAHAEEQTGICKPMNPAILCDISSVVNPATLGLSSTEQLPVQRMNICIPHVHLNVENHSPDRLGPPIPSWRVVMMVLATIGAIGLAGWMLYKRRPAFTEADINVGLMLEPAVAKQSNPTFEILPTID